MILQVRTSDRRVAVVTGANKGIGLEIARQLARRGVIVFIGSLRPSALQLDAER